MATVVKSWDSAYYHVKFDPALDDEGGRPDEVCFEFPISHPCRCGSHTHFTLGPFAHGC